MTHVTWMASGDIGREAALCKATMFLLAYLSAGAGTFPPGTGCAWVGLL